MINTQWVDASLIVLAILAGMLQAHWLYRSQRTRVQRLPLFLVVAFCFWNLFNWVGHLVAVLYVNGQALLQGNFTYSFHFYAVMLMGAVFLSLSLYQLQCIWTMLRGEWGRLKQLRQVSFLITAFCLPIIPLNPIGSLPIISAVVILATIALTRRQWVQRKPKGMEATQQVVPA